MQKEKNIIYYIIFIYLSVIIKYNYKKDLKFLFLY